MCLYITVLSEIVSQCSMVSKRCSLIFQKFKWFFERIILGKITESEIEGLGINFWMFPKESTKNGAVMFRRSSPLGESAIIKTLSPITFLKTHRFCCRCPNAIGSH